MTLPNLPQRKSGENRNSGSRPQNVKKAGDQIKQQKYNFMNSSNLERMQSKSKAESSSNMDVCVISGELTEDKKQPTPQSKAEDFSSRSMNKIEDVKSTASKDESGNEFTLASTFGLMIEVCPEKHFSDGEQGLHRVADHPCSVRHSQLLKIQLCFAFVLEH
eukprot:jgi/Bigna1/131107/aug1.13_g5815